jgi:menaquinone-9 beta-reductase
VSVPSTTRPERWDVLIVGGGPAGSAAALRALQLRPDAKVGIVDAADFPRDKTCGDGIAPHGLAVLRDLEAKDPTDGYAPVDRMRLRTPGGVELLAELNDPAYVIPRKVFDARLVAAAVDRGAVLLKHRVRNVQVGRHSVVLDGIHEATVVIGADGANSTVRRALGFGPNPPAALAIAVRGYADALPDGGQRPEQLIDMVDDGWPAYAWSFPIGDGRANIGYGKLKARLAGTGKAELHGTLARLLPETPAYDGTLRAHHLPMSTWRPRQPDGRALLVGDAASLINPLTGEGIFYAILSGSLAGEAAFAAEPGTAYRAALDRELGRHLRQTTVLATLVKHRPLMDAAMSAANGKPALIDGLIEVGLGRGVVRARSLAKVGVAYLERLRPGR